MFESLTLITISLILFFAWQNKALGLTAAVPKEPGARVHWQAAQALETFKAQLAGAVVKKLEESRIEVLSKVPAGSDGSKDELLCFWSEGGKVFRQLGAGKAETLHSLGPAGTVLFRLLSDHALFVKIVADSGEGATHEVGVRLDVTTDGPLFKPA